MALVRCILDKFIRVVCHCFPPPLDFPLLPPGASTSAIRDPSSERWNHGPERLYGNFAYMASLFTPLGIFYMPQIYDMGPTVIYIYVSLTMFAADAPPAAA